MVKALGWISALALTASAVFATPIGQPDDSITVTFNGTQHTITYTEFQNGIEQTLTTAGPTVAKDIKELIADSWKEFKAAIENNKDSEDALKQFKGKFAVPHYLIDGTSIPLIVPAMASGDSITPVPAMPTDEELIGRCKVLASSPTAVDDAQICFPYFYYYGYPAWWWTRYAYVPYAWCSSNAPWYTCYSYYYPYTYWATGLTKGTSFRHARSIEDNCSKVVVTDAVRPADRDEDQKPHTVEKRADVISPQLIIPIQLPLIDAQHPPVPMRPVDPVLIQRCEKIKIGDYETGAEICYAYFYYNGFPTWWTTHYYWFPYQWCSAWYPSDKCFYYCWYCEGSPFYYVPVEPVEPVETSTKPAPTSTSAPAPTSTTTTSSTTGSDPTVTVGPISEPTITVEPIPDIEPTFTIEPILDTQSTSTGPIVDGNNAPVVTMLPVPAPDNGNDAVPAPVVPAPVDPIDSGVVSGNDQVSADSNVVLESDAVPVENDSVAESS